MCSSDLMGHRRFGARVEETDVAGVKMLRCEILRADESIATLVHPQSLFALTPCTEEQARKANAGWGSYAPPEVRALPEPATVEPIDTPAEPVRRDTHVVEGLEHHDMTNGWCAIFDGEGSDPSYIGTSEEDVREQLIRFHMADDQCTREVAEEWLRDYADVCIARCALRVAWINHIDHTKDEPGLHWLDPNALPDIEL